MTFEERYLMKEAAILSQTPIDPEDYWGTRMGRLCVNYRVDGNRTEGPFITAVVEDGYEDFVVSYSSSLAYEDEDMPAIDVLIGEGLDGYHFGDEWDSYGKLTPEGIRVNSPDGPLSFLEAFDIAWARGNAHLRKQIDSVPHQWHWDEPAWENER